MTVDRIAMPAQRGGKGRRVGKAAGARQRGSRFAIWRQFVRLGVVAILQPVLEVAEEGIGIAKLGHRGRRQQSARRQRSQRRQRPARAQRRLAPASYQLQGLDDEFDLAYAAGSELDVGRVVLAPALAPDLAVNIAQAAVGVVVEIFSKHERLDQPLERVGLVPGQRSRLQPGIALPGPPLGDQIRFQRHERRAKGARVAIGSQPHVDPEHESVRRRFVKRGDDPAAETFEEFLIGERLASVARACLGVDEHQVDVR